MLKINTLPSGHREVVATEGYVVRKGEQPAELKRRGMLPGESIDDYEEIFELPPYTKAQYDEKVAALVRARYSESEEFAIQRKFLNALAKGKPEDSKEFAEAFPVIAEYNTYNGYVEQCKEEAKNPELYK